MINIIIWGLAGKVRQGEELQVGRWGKVRELCSAREAALAQAAIIWQLDFSGIAPEPPPPK